MFPGVWISICLKFQPPCPLKPSFEQRPFAEDEILPHGTMLELLRQGFSAAYDKVMYDRPGTGIWVTLW